MQTDVYIKIINEKMDIKFLVCWILVIPAIIAFGKIKIGCNSYNFWQQLLSIWELNLFQKISWSPLLFDINDSFLILSLQSFLFFLVCLKKIKKSHFFIFVHLGRFPLIRTLFRMKSYSVTNVTVCC